MFNDILPPIRFLPQNTSQSFENPLQGARLPEKGAPEFEYPVYQDDVHSARSRTLRSIVWMTLPILVLWSVQVWFPSSVYTQFLSSGFAVIAGWFFIQGLIPPRRFVVRWFGYCLGLPILAISAFIYRGPLLHCILASVATLRWADAIGSHYVHLFTAAPTDRHAAKIARGLWQKRFRNWFQPQRGCEAYLLPFVLVVACLCWIVYRFEALLHEQDSLPIGVYWLVVCTALFLYPIVTEPLLAYMFGRKPFSPRRMLYVYSMAVVESFTYNRLNTTAPGTFVSPVGSYYQRWRLAASAILFMGGLFANTWVSNPQSFFETAQGFPATSLHRGDEARHPLPLLLIAYQNPEDQAASPEAGDDFAPYQRQVLERLPKEERQKYIDQWRQAKEAIEQREAQQKAGTRQEPTTWNYILKTIFTLFVILFVIARALFRLLPIILPAATVLAAGFALAGRPLTALAEGRLDLSRQRVLRTETWDLLIERLRKSEDKVEKTSLLMGVNAYDDTPLLVPREVFREHVHFLGDSGSGKTALGIAPLVAQLMRYQDCSVIVLDLKADDQSLFEAVRSEAAAVDAARKASAQGDPQAGYDFRYFTTVLGRPSYIFNPLDQRSFEKLATFQRTDVLTAALGLQYGTDYGRKHYGDANYTLLNHVLNERQDVRSFQELAVIFEDIQSFDIETETKRASTNVRTAVKRLALCEPLNATKHIGYPDAAMERAIDLGQVFERPQALYFALPTAAGASTSSEIARMVLHTLLTAAQYRQEKHCQVYLFIDEFQRIIANNLEVFLQMARSHDIGFILANQAFEDLKQVDADLRGPVKTNTRFQQIFAATNESDLADISATSGETVVFSRSFEHSIFQRTWLNLPFISLQESTSPRLRVNEILLASDAPCRSIARLKRGAGYAQYGGMPFVVDSVFHVDSKEYLRRSQASWPSPSSETIVSTKESIERLQPRNPRRSYMDRRLVNSTPDLRPQVLSTTTTDETSSAATTPAVIEIPSTQALSPPLPAIPKIPSNMHLFEAFDDHHHEQQHQRERRPRRSKTPDAPTPDADSSDSNPSSSP